MSARGGFSPQASADFAMSEDLASRTSWGGGATYLEWAIDRFQQSLVTVRAQNLAYYAFGLIWIWNIYFD